MTIARSKITDLETVSEARYVYESPDGGKTVYQREVGTDKRYLVKSDPEAYQRQEMYKQTKRLMHITKLAKTDPTLKDALDRLEALYILKYGDEQDI